jgi:hypothetical protein
MTRAWLVRVDAEPEEIEVESRHTLRDLSDKYFGGATLDLTKGRYLGKIRTMAVSDTGMIDGEPVNIAATEAYQANCKPGTVWSIHGTAVIFESVLP